MKILRGTLFGGITFFFLGWLVYGFLLAGFMEANSNACANRLDTEMVWWAMILSNLILGLLLTLILKWSGASGIGDGIKTGALVGLLMALTMDLMMYSMTTLYNLKVLVVDVIAYTLLLAIMGLVIVLTWGKKD
ncbi:hypothetical protein [Draconibacterium sediminis]|uniref:DUF1761 domain-containing protein n=1 Tax=Draconibacterium sediminis TaxID=1544798 RepID=A0A0D8JEQ7_9BACT|nr:hypothetical protein [Draconibacterium sediminis]KJF44318.1 hypothetical protein LH29_02060 [Draconibacterium sediminis]